ncbi:hypothetical protein WJX72_009316 [[Myrmecia] bisecta]|uniref:Uncharacterized protein n=1 Tax=[Myrmecia] bisecta TaxID=41462 RepID=A0AAW1PYH7_9CHLO
MSILVCLQLILLLLVSALGIAIWYAVTWIGSNACLGLVRLVLQGSFRCTKACIRPRTTVLGPAVVQTAHLDEEQLFKADNIEFNDGWSKILTGRKFSVVVNKPALNLLADDQGLLHWVRLLQDVGILKEVKAKERPVPLQPAGGTEAGEAVTSTANVASLDYSAELRVLTGRVLFVDGLLQCPEDTGRVVGNNVQVKVLVGAANIQEEARERDQEASWVDAAPPPDPESPAGMLRYPMAVLLQSDNLCMEASGWRTSTGMLLRQPMSSSLAFTPALAKFALSKMHPLFSQVLRLEGQDSIRASCSPLEMHLPAECHTVRLEPMKLVLAGSGFVGGVLKLLNMRPGGGEPSSSEGVGKLQAWTSVIEADVYRSGQVMSKRMDILLTNGKLKIHVAMWGHVDTAHDNAVHMTLGIPAASLALAGIRGLPADFVLPIAVRGSSHKPEVHWVTATKQLADLMIQQQLNKPGFAVFNRLLKRHGPEETQNLGKFPPAPPANHPLPWEAFETDNKASKAAELSSRRSIDIKGIHRASTGWP